MHAPQTEWEIQTGWLDADVPQLRLITQPLLIAHRGVVPGMHCENTIAAFDAALAAGADGIEIDLCVTQDGHAVLWNDEDPNALGALLRQAGFEPECAFRPRVPPLFHPLRKRICALTLAEMIESHWYEHPDGLTYGVTLLSDVGTWAQRQAPAQLQRLVLDVKLADDASATAVMALARGMRDAFAAISERCTVLSVHPRILKCLRALLGPRFHYSLDVELGALANTDITGLDQGLALGNDTVSMGLPRLAIHACETFLHVLAEHGVRWGEQRPRCIAWTVNTERDARELVGCGMVDEMVTDHVPSLRRLFA